MNQKTVAMTFDDAVSNHATLAAPLLKKYHFNATFFVCEFPPDFATNKDAYGIENDGHPNARAAALLAQAVVDYLRRQPR